MEKLKTVFHINTLLLTGGGVINWSLLQAGMIDELSLVICPLADGRIDTASVFDRFGFVTDNFPVSFTLADVKRLDGSGVWLRYLPENTREKLIAAINQ